MYVFISSQVILQYSEGGDTGLDHLSLSTVKMRTRSWGPNLVL